MTIAAGVNKRVAYKKEVTWNTAPGASGAQYLRRVGSTLALAKTGYQSQEINSSYQVKDFRHGVRSVTGTLNGELSAGTWKDMFAAVVRKAFATTSAITGASITVAGTGPTYTITRAAGSFLTDGIKAGDVVRLTAGSFNAANLNKNLFVLAVTSATVLTVMPVNGVALFAEGPIGSATVSVPGKRAWMATSAQTDDSFSIEHWYSDISQSELFTGCKVQQMSIALPPSGMGTIALDFLGGNITTAGSQYYSTPTAETTTRLMGGVNGVMSVAGSAVGLLTALSFNAKGNMSGDPVVGQNYFPDIIEGRMEVDGQFTVLLQDATFRDYFVNETEVAIAAVMAADGTAAADFLGFSMPRVKLTSASRNDGEGALTLQCNFTALENTAGGTGVASEDTTLLIQDSQA